MVVKAEQERVKTLIADTVSLLCKNGLHYTKEFSIEGLLGITLDRDEVFLVNIKEMVKNQEMNSSDSEQSDEAPAKSRAHKRKRRRSKLKQTEGGNGDMDDSSNDTNASFAQGSVDNEPPAKKSNIKEERTEEESDDEDLVFIKDEPGQDFSAFTQNDQSFSGAQSNNILGDLSQQGSLYATPTSASGIAAQGWDPNQSANFSQHSMSSQPGTPNASGQQQVNMSPYGAVLQTGVVSHLFNKHDLSNQQAKAYTCDQCGRSFNSKNAFKNHSQSHVMGRQFKCDKCDKDYVYKKDLVNHQLAKHGDDAEKPCCPVCKQMFSYRANMIRHLQNMHSAQFQGLQSSYNAGADDSQLRMPTEEDSQLAWQKKNVELEGELDTSGASCDSRLGEGEHGERQQVQRFQLSEHGKSLQRLPDLGCE